MSHHEVASYIESVPFTVATVREAPTVTRRPRLSELKPRSAAPPL